MFSFSSSPADMSVSVGIRDAVAYFRASWRKWLPVVGLMAACAFALYALVGPLDLRTLYHTDVSTDRAVWNSDALSKLAGPMAARLAEWLLSVIGSWVFYAIAIAGLRNRHLTIMGVIVRGLATVYSGLVVLAVVLFVATGLLLVAGSFAVVAPPVGRLLIILVTLAAIPVAIYLLVRLVFTGMAIFDGSGPIEGLGESWRLSKGSVTRLFGWGLAVVAIELGFAVLWSIFQPLFGSPGTYALGKGLKTGASTAIACVVVFLLTTVYESERARKDPTLYPIPAWPGYGSSPVEPDAPGPYPARPYAPGPYTAGPYAGGPAPVYPADPGAIPGWAGLSYPPPAWATIPANPAVSGPADPDPNAAPMANSNETDPTRQPPNTPPTA